MDLMYLDRWKLRVACANKRLTMRETAERAGILPSRIYALSAGEWTPRIKELRLLAKVLKVEPKDLILDKFVWDDKKLQGAWVPWPDRVLQWWGVT